jgi:CHAD domain-containing protein
MSYRLGLTLDLAREVLRVEHDELERAFCELEHPDAKGIHEARKHIKKLRALLHLTRPVLGRAAFELAEDELRQAGRALAGARDRDALLEAFDRVVAAVAEHAESGPASDGLAPLRGRLGESDAPLGQGLATARDILATRLSQLDQRELKLGRRELVEGIADTYERGRKRLKKLRPGSPSEAFHDYRKQVKYHQHHLALIENAWPEALSLRRGQTDRLGEALGQHHDLAALEQALAQLAFEQPEIDAALQLVKKQIPIEREKLESETLALGARLYIEPPEAFAARIGGYVSLARDRSGS